MGLGSGFTAREIGGVELCDAGFGGAANHLV